jgi:hypothetical protein
MRTRLGFAALLPVFVFSGCNGCDAVLQDEPKPKAVLTYMADATPPLPNLTVAIAPRLLGSPVDTIVTLKNQGNAPLVVSNVVLRSDPQLCPQASGNYVIREPVSAGGVRALELAAGATRDITVRYVPSSGATDCVVLEVLSNDGANASLKAVFTGRGDAPRLCADKVLVDFGTIEAGMTRSDAVTLTACGTTAITLAGLTTNMYFPPFAHDAPALGTLAPGASLVIPVHFRPTDAGTWTEAAGRGGQINVTSSAGELYTITLVGIARTPPSCVLDANPVAVNFGLVPDTTTRTQDIVLTNRGERVCTVTSADVVAPAGPFSAAFVGGFAAGGTLMPQATATVRVSMTPAATGVFNAILRVASDDPVRATIDIPLEVNYPGEQPCLLDVQPATVNFGLVPVGTFRAMGINVRNAGSDICFISSIGFEPGTHPYFVDTSSNFNLLAAGATRTLTVGFRPTMAVSQATGRLKFKGSDAPFGGNGVDYFVQLSARTGTTGICVEPRHLDFGVVNMPTTRDFTISACGSTTVRVDALDWTTPDPEFAMVNMPTTPFTLSPGQAQAVTVRYTPTDADGDTAVITVRSDDGVNPAIPVDMTGGPEVVPPSAGRYLYYWQIPGIQGGDVMKFPLQGNTTPTPFWGPRTGKQCAGCHSVSPDGKYVAVLEVGTMRFVEAATGLELILGNSFLDPQYFSWRPNVNTMPPYQFAYGTGGVVKIAALFDGFIRDLQGANESGFLQTMPTWGTNGKIAFVKGIQAPDTGQQGATGFQGPTDIMVVDENGGVATPVPGASNNNKANYYPQFSPNAQWIAFTQSDSAQTTIAASDAKLRLVKMDNSATVLPLTNINSNTDGANSYPTWAVDGTFLSFSSNRSGGAGDWDIYVAPVNPITGADGAAQNIQDLNTADFEHAAQWSP